MMLPKEGYLDHATGVFVTPEEIQEQKLSADAEAKRWLADDDGRLWTECDSAVARAEADAIDAVENLRLAVKHWLEAQRRLVEHSSLRRSHMQTLGKDLPPAHQPRLPDGTLLAGPLFAELWTCCVKWVEMIPKLGKNSAVTLESLKGLGAPRSSSLTPEVKAAWLAAKGK